jgi:amino acid adenylation domain-containing protein
VKDIDLNSPTPGYSAEELELLAYLLEEEEGEVLTREAIPHRPPHAELQLSFAQERLWFLEQWEPGTPSQHIPLAIVLKGHLDVAALARSLDEIARRHEALRTSFAAVDGRPMQVIAACQTVPMTLIDLAAWPEAAREAELRRLADAEARRLFDLARAPLLRATLIRLGNDEHLLLLTLHHIVFDGWSLGVLIREVAALYAAFAAGKPSPLPELPLQYADYALWQRAWLQGAILESQLAYWTRQLAGTPPVLELPTDRPRPIAPTYDGAYQRFVLPHPLAGALATLTRQAGATLFMTLLAAFQTLLYRYNGQPDILIGTPIANRTRQELEALIGCFINTLVLRSDLSGAPSFRMLLRSVRQMTLDAYDHQDLPFELLVNALQLARDAGHTPLFQAMLVLQNAPMVSLELPGLTLELHKSPAVMARFDLLLMLAEDPAGLVGRFQYSTDMFDHATIDRMVAHFQTLLEGLVAAPDQPITDLPLLTAAERRQLLDDWNATQAPYPQEQTIVELFEAQVRERPEALALAYGDHQLSYQALNARANQLAHLLRQRGVGPEVLVGLAIERSVELVVGLLGVLKAGGAYVPLDPTYPQERLSYMLANSRATVLLTATNDERRTTISERQGDKETRRQGDREIGQSPISNLQSLDNLETQHSTLNTQNFSSILYPLSSPCVVVDLIADWLAIAQQPQANLDLGVAPDQLAYVIYTSGSTGRPKGVQIPHRALVNCLHSLAQRPGLCAADTLLAITTISFDIAALELLLPLSVGARVALISQETAMDGVELAACLRQTAATLMQATPATWRLLLAASWQGQPGLTALCGGEALPRELAAQLRERVGRLWNMYGPTETTIWSAVGAVEDAAPTAIIPLGQPLGNTQLYILDQGGQPTPVGVAGELYIGGAGLARGYRNRPDLTAEKFVPNPFADQRPPTNDQRPPTNEDKETRRQGDGEAVTQHSTLNTQHSRLYRTGDLARYRADGTLEFLGRLDHQVKVRGFRIELGEIEAVLADHAAIRQAVVLAREDVPGQKRLVAYIVPTNDQRPTTNIQATGRSPQQGDKQTSRQADGETVTQHSTLNTQNFSSILSELRAFLQDKLPRYMLPAAFVVLDELPLTPNGKVDRRALLAPAKEQSAQLAPYEPPRTEQEATLVQLWEQVLMVGRVGIHDNFFDLGGDSMMVIQLVARAHQVGYQLNPRQVFQYQTVAELAKCIDDRTTLRSDQTDQAIGVLPYVPQLEPFQNPNPALVRPIELPAGIGYEECYQVVRHIYAHHDILRLRLHMVDDHKIFSIAPLDESLVLHRVDLAADLIKRGNSAIQSKLEEIKKEFTGSNQGFSRFTFVSMGGRMPDQLLVILDHVNFDHYAIPLLFDDIDLCLSQVKQGSPVQLPPRTTSYREWALKMNEYFHSEHAAEHIAYWKRLPWKSAYMVPIDHPRGYFNPTFERKIIFTLEKRETQVLLDQIRDVYNANMIDVLLAGILASVQTRYPIGEKPFSVAALANQRIGILDDVDMSRTMGNFAGTCNILLWSRGITNAVDMLRSVQDQVKDLPLAGKTHHWFLQGDDPLVDNVRSGIILNYWAKVPKNPKRSPLLDLQTDAGYLLSERDSAIPAEEDIEGMVRWPEYVFDRLEPGATYLLRLHFVELHMTKPGERYFDVWVNRAPAITKLDIVQLAGARYRAISKEITCRADAAGRLALNLVSCRDSAGKATISGIELLRSDVHSALQPVVQINAGGPCADTFQADSWGSGGASYATELPIDLSGLVAAAPLAVYQSEYCCAFKDETELWPRIKLTCLIQDDRLEFWINWFTNLHRRETIDALGQSLFSYLRALIEQPAA